MMGIKPILPEPSEEIIVEEDEKNETNEKLREFFQKYLDFSEKCSRLAIMKACFIK